MKTLLIITRATNEFDGYWNGRFETINAEFTEVKPLIKQNSDCCSIIFNGQDFTGNNETIDFGQQIIFILQEALPNVDLTNSDKIGIIYHGGADNRNIQTLKAINPHIAFIKKYSAKNNTLCNHTGDHFTITGDRSKPLDAFRDAFINKKDQSSEKFQALWNYFEWDELLEARLELLHHCLTPEERDNIVWQDKIFTLKIDGKEATKEIGSKGKNEFKDLQKVTNDPSGTKYVEALTALRNTLLEEY